LISKELGLIISASLILQNNMAKLTIDGREVEVENGLTVIQACQIAGVEIPRFCYHEKLSIAGNCRMCLVEIEKAPKLVASCAMPVSDGMVIKTNSEKVTKAREGVMELLLINHPLDCPICDQGGECDLQDQAYAYGRGSNRFHENKRSVKDKDFGPLVATNMTRCIQCTRCIRFSQEIAGVPELGAIYRGEHMEVTSYLERGLSSELSGNLIDICPVGALTSKPYAFKGRSWELKHTESIDVLDAVGSNIRVDYRGLTVMRIQPRTNEDINEEWISDKTRFAFDGLRNQRLDICYIRKDGRLVEAGWDEAISLVGAKLHEIPSKKMLAVAGPMSDLESMFALKKLFSKLGSQNIDFNQYGYKFDLSARGNYLFNTTIAGIENADFCLLVGADPRHKATMVNARIRKAVVNNNLYVARIGEADDQTYEIEELGESLDILKKAASGMGDLAKKLKEAKNPMIIIGDGIYSRKDADAIFALVHKLVKKFGIVRDDWNGFNILHNHAATVGALDIGFYPMGKNKGIADIAKMDLVYLLSADDVDFTKISKDAFVIYQGHHGDAGANRADVILPGAAYTEKNGTYVNLEGMRQNGRMAVPPPGEAREDFRIICDIAQEMKIDLGFITISDVRKQLPEADSKFLEYNSDEEINEQAAVKKVETNYYMTDVISRASKTMADCILAAKAREEA
jgi:NADH-quinone oxidoreductase subunit G